MGRTYMDMMTCARVRGANIMTNVLKMDEVSMRMVGVGEGIYTELPREPRTL